MSQQQHHAFWSTGNSSVIDSTYLRVELGINHGEDEVLADRESNSYPSPMQHQHQSPRPAHDVRRDDR